jgi:hypothetical protein
VRFETNTKKFRIAVSVAAVLSIVLLVYGATSGKLMNQVYAAAEIANCGPAPAEYLSSDDGILSARDVCVALHLMDDSQWQRFLDGNPIWIAIKWLSIPIIIVVYVGFSTSITVLSRKFWLQYQNWLNG